MSYIQLRFAICRDRADALSTALEELGALSISWENAGDDDYLEVAYPKEPDWQEVHLTGLFDSSCEPERIINSVNKRFGSELPAKVNLLEEQDWERAWSEQLKPRRYGDLWVCPSWIEPPDPHATNIILDPGLAFGTGEHPTTSLCLDWISRQDLLGRTVLDFGCGSGILAIACLLKGAARAYAVDVDPRALSVSERNAALNGVAEKYEPLMPGDLAEGLRVDLTIANILASVLVDRSDILTRATRRGGRLLLTGILGEQVERVETAFRPLFDFEFQTRDEWWLLIGQKR